MHLELTQFLGFRNIFVVYSHPTSGVFIRTRNANVLFVPDIKLVNYIWNPNTLLNDIEILSYIQWIPLQRF